MTTKPQPTVLPLTCPVWVLVYQVPGTVQGWFMANSRWVTPKFQYARKFNSRAAAVVAQNRRRFSDWALIQCTVTMTTADVVAGQYFPEVK